MGPWLSAIGGRRRGCGGEGVGGWMEVVGKGGV